MLASTFSPALIHGQDLSLGERVDGLKDVFPKGLPFTLGEEVFRAEFAGVSEEFEVSLRRGDELLHLLLSSICFPSYFSPARASARDYLRQALGLGLVEVHVEGYEVASGRPQGRLLVGSRDLRLELLERGWACYCRRQRVEPTLAAAERRAKEERVGVWAELPPTSGVACGNVNGA